MSRLYGGSSQAIPEADLQTLETEFMAFVTPYAAEHRNTCSNDDVTATLDLSMEPLSIPHLHRGGDGVRQANEHTCIRREKMGVFHQVCHLQSPSLSVNDNVVCTPPSPQYKKSHAGRIESETLACSDTHTVRARQGRHDAAAQSIESRETRDKWKEG